MRRLLVIFALASATSAGPPPPAPSAGAILVVVPANATRSIALPGFPLRLDVVEPASVLGVAESPGPRNGWRAIMLRNISGKETLAAVYWTRID